LTAGQGNRTTTIPATPDDFVRYLNVRSAYGVSFAPDGRHITFLTDITGVAEVWRVTLASGRAEAEPAWPEQLTFGGERIAGASYSPTDDRLIVGGDVGGNERTQLYLMSGDGTTLTPLTNQPDAIHVFGGWQEDGASSNSWSPDGKRIVYASNARDPRYFDIFERDLDATGYVEQAALLRQGAALLGGNDKSGRREALKELAALNDFMAERLPQLKEEWRARRSGLT